MGMVKATAVIMYGAPRGTVGKTPMITDHKEAICSWSRCTCIRQFGTLVLYMSQIGNTLYPTVRTTHEGTFFTENAREAAASLLTLKRIGWLKMVEVESRVRNIIR